MGNNLSRLEENGLTSYQQFMVDAHTKDGMFEFDGSKRMETIEFMKVCSEGEAALDTIRCQLMESDEMKRYVKAIAEKTIIILPVLEQQLTSKSDELLEESIELIIGRI